MVPDSTTGRRARHLWRKWCWLVHSNLRSQNSSGGAEWLKEIAAALGPEPASIRYRLEAIARGYALLRAAHLDFTPAIGRSAATREPSRLDVVRGLQWRLVLSVAGFEMFLRGRVGRDEKIWKLVRHAISYVLLEPPPTVPSPRIRSTDKRRWISLESLLDIPLPTRRLRLAEFLSLNKFEEPLLLDWLRGERTPIDWEEHFQLATALRNVTAHGALSAKKARDLGMRRAFYTLPGTMLSFATATLEGPVRELSEYAIRISPVDVTQRSRARRKKPQGGH
jgi:hypothetical protein